MRIPNPAPYLLALCIGIALIMGARGAAAAEAIAWGNAVPWLDYETALARAKAEGKAVGVVVYADWCSVCRALAPQFTAGPVLEASPQVLWVLQNEDAAPEWLQQGFGEFGSYVPRIFFLRPDGSVDRDITSGHPRYPYFYLAGKPETLVASIVRAAAAAGPATPPAPQPAPQPVALAPTPAAPAAPASRFDLAGDLPLLGVLLAVALGAVWAHGHGKNEPS